MTLEQATNPVRTRLWAAEWLKAYAELHAELAHLDPSECRECIRVKRETTRTLCIFHDPFLLFDDESECA